MARNTDLDKRFAATTPTAAGVSARPPFRTVDGGTCRHIQAAIDELPHGGTVVLPPGRFTVEKTILLTDEVTVLGAGSGVSVLELAPGSGCHVFSNADQRGGNRQLGLCRFSVLGNGDAQERPSDSPSLSFCNAVYLKSVHGIRIADVIASDIRQTGLHFNSCVDVRVDDFLATRVGWSAISTSATDHIVVQRLLAKDAGLDTMHSAVHFDGGYGVRLVDGWIADCTGNAVMLDSAYGPLSHCDISSVCKRSKRGVSLSGSATHALGDVAIRGGTYSQNREVGILISNAEHVVVSDALIEENGEYGVLLQGRVGGRHCLVSGCTLVGNKVGIAEVHQSSDNAFLANRFLGNQTDVRLQSAPPPAPPPPPSPAPPPQPDQQAGPPDYPSDAYEGHCWVCGHRGSFERRHRAIRETYSCPSCRANLRYQAQGAALVRLFSQAGATSVAELVEEPAFRGLTIYEPGVLGPFRSLFRSLPGYTVSDYWPDVPPGTERDGVRCESLMALTYPDESFDLVITSDIFEHVRDPYKGFAEIGRVLRKGGSHVFSIPVLHPLAAASVQRVDTSGPEDVPILEPRYHLGPGNSQHIVYTDFGADLLDRLAEMGFPTEAVRFPSSHADLDRVVTFCSIKRV